MTGEKVALFQERIKELIQSSPKSQTALASEIGVAKQTISAWITGQTSPRSPMVVYLADYFHVSVGWLMGYDVEKNVDEKAVQEYDTYVQETLNAQKSLITLEESKLIDSYRSLSDKGRAYIDEQMSIAVQLYVEKPASSEKIG